MMIDFAYATVPLCHCVGRDEALPAVSIKSSQHPFSCT